MPDTANSGFAILLCSEQASWSVPRFHTAKRKEWLRLNVLAAGQLVLKEHDSSTQYCLHLYISKRIRFPWNVSGDEGLLNWGGEIGCLVSRQLLCASAPSSHWLPPRPRTAQDIILHFATVWLMTPPLTTAKLDQRESERHSESHSLYGGIFESFSFF